MKLRKAHTPGAAPGGLVWSTPDDVVEVPDELAVELLAIPGAGFEYVPHLPVSTEVRTVEAPSVAEIPKRKYTRRTGEQQNTTD
ncbi:hypothetical protein [Kitasatospora sp. NPDC056731]|uniref:hypothetical protein n=1 Tax=Kitasatospora sp. NPDC056731 TaxID=3155422 RepID=UPI003425DFD4